MSSETKFTPGPYFRSDATVYALNPEGYNSMSALVQSPHTPTRTLEATAQLFTAAPDLYEALDLLLSEEENGTVCNIDRQTARDALAKARGES